MKKETADRILEKVRDDYDRIADDFSASRTRLWPEMERFRGLVRAGDRVLDVGCGNGRAYQLVQGMAIEYDGVDVSKRLIAIARDTWRDLLAQFRVGSLMALPYEDGDFDAVMAIAVLHHVPSREYRLAALREVHRVLKQGGSFFMTNWDRWDLARYWKQHATALVGKLFGTSGLDFKDLLIPWKADAKAATMRYYHAFTKGELRRLCEAAGFEVVEHYYVKEGVKTGWWRGDNLVTICRKP